MSAEIMPPRSWGDSPVSLLNITPSYDDQSKATEQNPSSYTQVETFPSTDVGVGTRRLKSQEIQAKIVEPTLSSGKTKESLENIEKIDFDKDTILLLLNKLYNLLVSTAEERAMITNLLVSKCYGQGIEVCGNTYSLETLSKTLLNRDASIYCHYCYGKLLLFGEKLSILSSFWPMGPSTTGALTAFTASDIIPFNSTNYVTTVVPHPSLSNKLAVGTIKGTVSILTLNFTERTISVISTINKDISHTGRVIFIQWFNMNQVLGIITASTDGKILVWEVVRSDPNESGFLRLYSGVGFLIRPKNVTTGSNLSKSQIYKSISSVQLLQGLNTPKSLGFIVAFDGGTIQEISFFLKPAIAPKFYEDLLDTHKTGLKTLRQYGLMPGTRSVQCLPQILLKSVTNKAQLIYLNTCRLILQGNGSLIMSEVQSNATIQKLIFKSEHPLTDFIVFDKTIIAIDIQGSVSVFSFLADDVVVHPIAHAKYSTHAQDWTITLCSYQMERSAIILAKCRKEARVLEVPLISSILTNERYMARLYMHTFSP
ncbi:Hypothetical protein GLP15_3347 [Giardia lamblia P15]|uniref:WD-repeat family protein n=1 Tax=Giardia intestinalis (strain P15) TaxID=658858 RepID=E1EVU5_GIAIA|nr:Hypothetical protein GLP15_3347 [Giardia lamblia P15]